MPEGKVGASQPGEDGGRYALWGSRFGDGLAPEAAALNRSLPVDRRLWREELEVAGAWLEALAEQRLLTGEDPDVLAEGLARVGQRLAGGIAETAADEDIHTLVERLLFDEVGQLAGKLRTGRSRNDQVATISRLWVMRAVDTLDADVARLQTALLARAERTVDLLAPAYTHLRRAQSIRFAHLFLSHFWPLDRDRRRLATVGQTAAALPLGSGAVAGSGFPVDREFLRRRLGFEAVAPNSIDAVADRDYVAEFAFAGALLGVHLSKLAEDLIILSSAEFGFVRFADAYSTGSSLMAHKRNPDIAEVARGKSGLLLGAATAALALLKSLPSGYNKDLQEDKSILFEVGDTLRLILPALAGAIETLEVDVEATRAALDPDLLTVDLADALVRAGVTFHDAHAAVGALVRLAERSGTSLLGVSETDAGAVHPALPAALGTLMADGTAGAIYERSVESRAASGGTARSAILDQIGAARSSLAR